MQLNSQKSGSVCPYIGKHTLLSVGGQAVSSGTLALSLWPLTGHTGKAHPLKPAHLPLHCQPTSSHWENKINHQPNHSLRKIYIPVGRYKYIHQIILYLVSLRLNSITAKRYNYINLTITAKRAFRGMAGLAVLYPSVVDCMGWRVKTLSRCLPDDFRGYSVNLCRWPQLQPLSHPSGSPVRLESHPG